MAVYTHVGPEQVSALLANYDAGDLISLKGIAEGVENSNYFVETTKSRFILTLYENRVNPDDLPFFHALLDHLHAGGCKVPRFINDRHGRWLHDISGKNACLIEFLSGVSVTAPTFRQAYAAGHALGEMHRKSTGFTEHRPNSLGMEAWRPLADKCGRSSLETIAPGLSDRIYRECDYISRNWPVHLPQGIIHADLFPDNILMLGNDVSGLIDFYFACTDIIGYDIAVTHAAWSFSADGGDYHADIGTALLAGYQAAFPIDAETREALPILMRGACLRFLLTRSYDWINTPANALVTRKDPLAFLRRLEFYAALDSADRLFGDDK